MNVRLFLVALLGGVIGFWAFLLLAAVLGFHEKIHIMSIVLVGSGVTGYVSLQLFKKCLKYKHAKTLSFLIIPFAIALLAYTFWRINR